MSKDPKVLIGKNVRLKINGKTIKLPKNNTINWNLLNDPEYLTEVLSRKRRKKDESKDKKNTSRRKNTKKGNS